MKKWHSILCICTSVITAFSSVSYAGNRPKTLTFTLGDGVEIFSSKRHIQNANIPFGILGYNITDHWGVEALLSPFNADFKSNVDEDKQINGTLFLFNGVYRFTPYKFVEPYVLAGVGVTGLRPNLNDPNNQANVNAGLGVQLFFEHSIAFRFDARDLYTIVAGGRNDLLFSAGITFLLDMC